jgi:hypothetical protein
MENKWQELLKQQSPGMGSFDLNNDNQENRSANEWPNERKRKSKLKLGLIKG